MHLNDAIMIKITENTGAVVGQIKHKMLFQYSFVK